jgi:microsomal epoxide hydrolase
LHYKQLGIFVKGEHTMEKHPFTIDVPQVVLDDLKGRLARTRWPDEVEGAGWDYGTNLNYLKTLVDYWLCLLTP